MARKNPTTPQAFLELSFAQERQRIVKKLWQIRQDIDSFNENQNPETPIVFVYDFTRDLDELDAARAALTPPAPQ